MGKETIIAIVRGIDGDGYISDLNYHSEDACCLEIESYEHHRSGILALQLFNGNVIIVHAVNCTIIRKKNGE